MPPPAVPPDGTPKAALSGRPGHRGARPACSKRSRTPPIIPYEAGGEDWLGSALPFDGIQGLPLQLLATAPADELLGDLARNRTFMVLMSSALILLLLPLGWRTGGAVGRALERLAERAQENVLVQLHPPRLPAHAPARGR